MNNKLIKTIVFSSKLKLIESLPKGKKRNDLLDSIEKNLHDFLSSSKIPIEVRQFLDSRHICPISHQPSSSPRETNKVVILKVLISSLKDPGGVVEFAVGRFESNHWLLTELVNHCMKLRILDARIRSVRAGRWFITFVSVGPKKPGLLKQLFTMFSYSKKKFA